MTRGTRTIAIVQARLRSSRLPAKILLDLVGKTALERMLERASRIEGVTEVVVATSTATHDDVVAEATNRYGYRVVRGSEMDVLSRYALAVAETRADVAIRLTSDCPFLDPAASSAVLRAFLSTSGADYASNTISRKMPRGLDTEVVAASALLRAHRQATAASEREHVTMHIYRNPDKFLCVDVAQRSNLTDLSHHRWTLDTIEDYHFLYEITSRLGSRAETASTEEIASLIESAPTLLDINATVTQKGE